MAVDYSKLLNSILDKFPTPEDTLAFFERNHKYFTVEGGYYEASNFNYHMKKFSSRASDKTPSTLCKPRLRTIDFGDTQRVKDILQYIVDIENEKENGENWILPKNFPQVVQKLANILDVDENQNLDNYEYVPPPKQEEAKAKPYTEKYINKQILNAFKNDKSKKIFVELMEGLCRSCSKDEMKRAAKVFNIGLNNYMQTEEVEGSKKPVTREIFRLFIPEYSRDLQAFGSFRYNRNEEGRKGLLRKNSQRVLFGIHLSHVFDKEKPIIFSEGHSDVIVNNAKRIQTITSASATTPIGDNIEEMKGKTYHLFYDLDEPGVKGITERVYEIEKFNFDKSKEDKIKYKIFLWSSKMIVDDKIVDMIDFEETQRKAINRLKSDRRNKFPFSEDELFEKSKVSSWRVLSNEPKKKGYDWIDFHTEMKEHPKYNIFIDQYKY